MEVCSTIGAGNAQTLIGHRGWPGTWSCAGRGGGGNTHNMPFLTVPIAFLNPEPPIRHVLFAMAKGFDAKDEEEMVESENWSLFERAAAQRSSRLLCT